MLTVVSGMVGLNLGRLSAPDLLEGLAGMGRDVLLNASRFLLGVPVEHHPDGPFGQIESPCNLDGGEPVQFEKRPSLADGHGFAGFICHRLCGLRGVCDV